MGWGMVPLNLHNSPQKSLLNNHWVHRHTTTKIFVIFWLRWFWFIFPALHETMDNWISGPTCSLVADCAQQSQARARFLSLAWSKLWLCSAHNRPGYLSNLPCDWPGTAWANAKQATENGPWPAIGWAQNELTKSKRQTSCFLWAQTVLS